MNEDYYVKSKKVTLTDQDFVAKGGEKKIFRKGDIAYAIYEDLTKMIPPAKIGELSEMNHPSIVRPLDVIFNLDNHPIGFTMPFLDEEEDDITPLPRLFTNTFRDKNAINNDMAIELVKNLKNVFQFIHGKKGLIVDGNEMNYLVGEGFIVPYLIDVNSLKTRSFPATAYHPATRDWTTTGDFNELTDWFIFAIISFQIIIGVHPFKGSHPGYAKKDFINRIKDCVSVFNDKVSLPPPARDFSIIPANYKDWYFNTFENGMRTEPPQMPGEAGKVAVKAILVQSTDSFEIISLREFPEDLLYYNHLAGVAKTRTKIFIGRVDYDAESDEEVVFTPLTNIPVFVKLRNKLLIARTTTPGVTFMPFKIEGNDMMIIGTSLYLKRGKKLTEIGFKDSAGKIVMFVKKVWQIEKNSSKMFSGIVTQSVLGKAHVVIPVVNGSRSSCFVKAIPELDDYQIMDAKHENFACILVGRKGIKYDRIVLTFDRAYGKYRCIIQEDVDFLPVNFTVLDNGLAIHITDDDAVEIFFNDSTSKKAWDLKRIEDPAIDSSMRLCKDGTRVLFFKGNKLHSMKMR
jgi:hypothetical protein